MENRVWIKGEVLGRWVAGRRVVVAGEIFVNVQHFSTATTIHSADRGGIKRRMGVPLEETIYGGGDRNNYKIYGGHRKRGSTRATR